jgi:hypothetical protein
VRALIERQAGRLLQAPVAHRLRDAAAERPEGILAAYERHVTENMLVSASNFADQLAVDELARVAHRVHQHHMREATPRSVGLQDGEEGRDAGAGRDQP